MTGPVLLLCELGGDPLQQGGPGRPGRPRPRPLPQDRLLHDAEGYDGPR